MDQPQSGLLWTPRPLSGNFIAIGDLDGDGRNDIVINDGPSVLLQSATVPGSFRPPAPLR
jgi:hypothetical protein